MRAAKQRVAATKGKSLKQARQALEINNLEAILTAVFNKGRVKLTLTKNAKWLEVRLIRTIPDNNGGSIDVCKYIDVYLNFLEKSRDDLLIQALHFQSDFGVVKELL